MYRRSRRKMSTFAVALAGLSPEQVTLLSGSGILNDVDLGTLSQSDFDEILPTATLVTRRRLFSIGQYVTSGETLTSATSMLEILTKINNKNTSPTTVTAAHQVPFFQDPSRGAPKMYVDGLSDFGGAPIKWEDWHIGTGATLGQTVYSQLLSTAPVETDVLQKTRDRELYFMFKKALYQGSAYHIVEHTASRESGHQVWRDLNEWYGSAEVSRTVIDYYRNKLNSLKLTQTSEANDQIPSPSRSKAMTHQSDPRNHATPIATKGNGLRSPDVRRRHNPASVRRLRCTSKTRTTIAPRRHRRMIVVSIPSIIQRALNRRSPRRDHRSGRNPIRRFATTQ